MNRSQARSRLVLATIALCCLLPLPAAAGLVLEQQMRTEGASAMNMAARVWVSDQGGKIETIEGPENPLFKKGGYILMRPNDPAMTMVDPGEKTYMRLDVGQMMQAMQPAQPQAPPQPGQGGGNSMIPKFSDAKIEQLLDEEGPAMLGYPTRHQKFHITYTMTMSMAGMDMVTATDATEETWSTEAVGDLGAAKLLNSAGGMPGSSELSKLGDAKRSADVKGLVLKRIVASTSKMLPTKGFGGGMMSKMMNKGMKPTRTVMEITKLEKENLPASMFAIPAGYTEVDMFGGSSKMPDLNEPPGN